MVGEWVWGIVSALAGLVAVLGFSTWFLLLRVPTADSLFQIGEALFDKKIGDLVANPPDIQGRPQEGIWGMIQSFLQTPQGAEMAQNFLGGGGSGSFTAGLKR